MKNVFTFCCALCLLALTACGSAPKISEEASDLEVNNHEGVTMTVVDGSAYPGQVEVTILNTTDTEIDSGNSADFFLQVEQDGQWYNLIPKQTYLKSNVGTQSAGTGKLRQCKLPVAI